MKKILLFGIVFIVCVGMAGCTYSSANLMRVSGDHVKVFGAWGYVDCTNAAVTMYTGRSTNSTKKEDYAKIPAMPDIVESRDSMTVEHK